MSNQKIQQLANKYADQGSDPNQKFQEQRVRLSNFFDTFHKQYHTVMMEMEGDLRVLREKEFDKNLWKIFGKLWATLIDLGKRLDADNIYPSIGNIVNYASSRSVLPVIDNLDFLIQNFMKHNQVDFLPSNMIQTAKIKSLKNLKRMLFDAGIYMKNNPLIAVPGNIVTDFKTKNEGEEFSPPNVGSEEVTNIVGKINKS